MYLPDIIDMIADRTNVILRGFTSSIASRGVPTIYGRFETNFAPYCLTISPAGISGSESLGDNLTFDYRLMITLRCPLNDYSRFLKDADPLFDGAVRAVKQAAAEVAGAVEDGEGVFDLVVDPMTDVVDGFSYSFGMKYRRVRSED